jgi:hypothetical protein
MYRGNVQTQAPEIQPRMDTNERELKGYLMATRRTQAGGTASTADQLKQTKRVRRDRGM